MTKMEILALKEAKQENVLLENQLQALEAEMKLNN